MRTYKQSNYKQRGSAHTFYWKASWNPEPAAGFSHPNPWQSSRKDLLLNSPFVSTVPQKQKILNSTSEANANSVAAVITRTGNELAGIFLVPLPFKSFLYF